MVVVLALCSGSSLGGLGRGSRIRFGAMDWTAPQRVSLALTRGALCLTVQSAREQQSLHTWFVQYSCSGITADTTLRGECSMTAHTAATFSLVAWPLQHYCKWSWDDDALSYLNSFAWPRRRTACI